MDFLIIGANGGVGKHVTKLSLDRGHNVTACTIDAPCDDARAAIENKDLFSLTSEEIKKYDAVLSCFGSGFECDPVINRDVCLHYINIFKGTGKRILHLIGSGSLFSDESHSKRVYENPGHPSFLKGISMNATLGLEAFQNSLDVNYTVVMPSLVFENTENGTGKYQVGFDIEPIFKKDGKSYCTYYDLACAMVDFAEKELYNQKVVTILSE